MAKIRDFEQALRSCIQEVSLMLSYQHGYHAGNYADVAKHILLSRLLNYLLRKDKSLLYLETHAGRGLYDLKSAQATKTNEAQQGIQLLWQARQHLPEIFSEYMQILAQLNPNAAERLHYYPGSPYLAIHQLRQQDRIICCELHPQEFTALERIKKQGKRVVFLAEDGLLQLKALLPPLEKRGLIFIDPTYEMKTDYKAIPLYLNSAYKRFQTGVFVLWYPIVEQRSHEQLLRGLKQIKAQKSLRVEFWLNQKQTKLYSAIGASTSQEPRIDNASSASRLRRDRLVRVPSLGVRDEGKKEEVPLRGMQGCGLWIINPPYMMMEEAKTVLQVLTQYFNPGASSFVVQED